VSRPSETSPSSPGPSQPPDPGTPWATGPADPPPAGGYGEVAGPYGPPGQFGAPGDPSTPGEGAPPYGTEDRTRVRLWPPSRREWTTALATLAALAAVGAAVAPLWVHLAPRLAFRVSTPGTALPVVPEAEEYIAADGRYVIITLVIGIVAGLAGWLVRRSRGPWALLALAAGGLLGAVVTWRLGMLIGTGYRESDLRVVGKIIYQPLTLRARAALVVEPVAAVIVYLLAAGFSSRNDLGRDDGTEERLSSGSG
jgi:hypothetical protein